MKKFIIILILIIPGISHAAVYGGTNLGYSGYPEFDEREPSPPVTDDQYAWEAYRQEVDRYTEQAKEYLENSSNDIKRIQEAQEEAIEKANRVVREYNSQVR
ncbi:hypothetical protein [Atlantibacter hermannii]|uniref:hypothetical protein n=1 Tax=Atlantibacter hermannii TaxID=565 RepID=UPI00296EDAF4|nr:hypothetical protein [Atlantibacter hermannii]MDW4578491.1 hypothetical protein [Atlantibacter hermannii]